MNIDEAIELARERRTASGQHQAVIQNFDQYRVVELRKRRDLNPAWTTQEDMRFVERQHYRKALPEDIPLIRALGADGMTVTEIARKFEVARTTVRRLLKAAA